MNEPSVLDYLKSLFTPWKGPLPQIPAAPVQLEAATALPSQEAQAGAVPDSPALPESQPFQFVEAVPEGHASLDLASLLISLLFLGSAYLVFIVYTAGKYGGEPRFNLLNVLLTLLALYFMGKAFWVAEPRPDGINAWWEAQLARLTGALANPLALVGGLLAIGVVLFFRLYRLGEVPPEMNSDHAEKILDILRVLKGEYHIFFAGNGGREALIFYLGAAVHQWLGLPLGFMALKIVSVAIGLAAQPFIFLLGKELGGSRVGWLAFVLSGVAYWSNVVARFGLRLPFYVLFTAATLYYLLRGLRTARRNDFIWAGAWLGLGMYGYTPDRLLPLTVLVAVGLYALHRRTPRHWQFAATGLLALVAVSFVLFMPLMTYIITQPDLFLARTVTRMGNAEQPLDGSAPSIFVHNVTKALGMFSSDAGVIWPISIPNHPALGDVALGLFFLGIGLVFVRYIRQRQWTDLLLLVSIPLLQLPSTLALAFPDENPNLYRTGGTLVPVFLIAALALDWLMRWAARLLGAGTGKRLGWWLAWGLGLMIIGLSAFQEYQLVFKDYYQQYLLAAQNTSEMGEIARGFIAATGSPETVYVMGFPYWVDSRLVAINAGFAGLDFRIFPNELGKLDGDPRPKLFFVHVKDEEGMQALRQSYPQGWFEHVKSRLPEHDFLVFFSVPKNDTP